MRMPRPGSTFQITANGITPMATTIACWMARLREPVDHPVGRLLPGGRRLLARGERPEPRKRRTPNGSGSEEARTGEGGGHPLPVRLDTRLYCKLARRRREPVPGRMPHRLRIQGPAASVNRCVTPPGTPC